MKGARKEALIPEEQWKQLRPGLGVSFPPAPHYTTGLFMVPRSRSAKDPGRRSDVVVNVYGPASGLSERTNHSPCRWLVATEGYTFWEARVRPLRWTQGGSARSVTSFALRERGTIISP